MKTLAQLVTGVKALIDDSAMPDATIKVWLNDALRDLTPALRLEGRAVSPMLAGKDEYGIPEDLFRIRALKISTEDAPRNPVRFTDFTTEGYKHWGKAIILQPPPAVDGEIELWYWRVPKMLTEDGDTPEVPQPFQHLLVWYASAMYQVYDKEAELEQTMYYPKYQSGKAVLSRYTAARAAMNSVPLQWRIKR